LFSVFLFRATTHATWDNEKEKARPHPNLPVPPGTAKQHVLDWHPVSFTWPPFQIAMLQQPSVAVPHLFPEPSVQSPECGIMQRLSSMSEIQEKGEGMVITCTNPMGECYVRTCSQLSVPCSNQCRLGLAWARSAGVEGAYMMLSSLQLRLADISKSIDMSRDLSASHLPTPCPIVG